MSVISTAWIIIQMIVGYNLLLPLVINSIYMLRRLFKHLPTHEKADKEADYAIIVTAYEQITFLPEVVRSLLSMNYHNYVIYIVADNCDVSDLSFNSNNVILLRPFEIIRSNTGSHFYAIKHFIRPHDRLTIIDSDNLVDADYLNNLNYYFDKGYQAVQGVREAKNLNTMYSCLDAARDKYYHYYDGKLLFGAGSSATLAGSGMAFTTSLYKECLEHLDVTGAGFDKVLQYQIVNSGKRIAFSEKAIVYDEKTTKSEQLVKQRSRWINSWFRYSHFGIKLTGKGLSQLNWNQLLFGIVLLRPPLFIFLLLSLLFLFVNIYLDPIVAAIWVGGFLLFIVGFLVALLSSDTNKKIYQSLIGIPKFIFYQIVSLARSGKANEYSVATKHETNN